MTSRTVITLIIISLLTLSSFVTWLWGRSSLSSNSKKLQHEVHLRINSWWLMSAVLLSAWWCGFVTTIVLFLFLSVLALREYITLIDTARADHRALVWSFLLAPIHYYLILIQWYGLFSIFIPVYGFLFISTRIAVSGDCNNFLGRTATIFWGLMTCIFLPSHASAILSLPLVGFEGRQPEVFLFLVLLTELSDIYQFMFGKAFGRIKISPSVSPNKTLEGLLGGTLASGLTAGLLTWLTPMEWYLDILIGCLICILGFFGGLTMSAVKRDKGYKDFGTLIAGHGGVLDRMDSLCFTAPLFFHYLRYFHTSF